LGDELKKNLGAEIELVAGSNGVFDISLDGNMIYSKFKEGRFPQTDEILARVSHKSRRRIDKVQGG
jgi:selenoprotein W-related protein